MAGELAPGGRPGLAASMPRVQQSTRPDPMRVKVTSEKSWARVGSTLTVYTAA